MSLIIYSIPVFFLLIGIEVLIAKMKGLSYYRFNDAITNLSCGISSEVAKVFLRTFTFIGYTWLYEHTPLRIDGNLFVSMFQPATEGGIKALQISGTLIIGTVLFVGVDFFYYWFHRLAHEISILWGSHVVHHQSEEYNLTVALRQAALQGAFSWAFYLPLAVLGFSPAMFITVASLQTLYQFWIHTKLINKMHPAFEYIFNTPSHHRVHHGVNPKYIDKNHGGTLIIFDRMFGTFQAEEEEVVYGITKQPKSWNPVWVNFEYWIELFADVFKVHKVKDGILMLIKMPGWKPKDLGGEQEFKEVSPQTFHKYDTEISAGLNYYILVQFVVVLLGATAFLITSGKGPISESWPLKILIASLITVALLNIGGIFERKSWAPLLEVLRLAAMVAIVGFLFRQSQMFLAVTIVTAVVAVVSLIWLAQYIREFKINNNNVQVNAG
ncbi:MAG: sterol desaturase family protein [Chitinophagales bacterium]